MRLETRMIFRPVAASADWEAPPAEVRAEDVPRTLPDGTRLHGWWCPPPGWQPNQGVLLYCHGNAGNLSHRGNGILTWNQRMRSAVLIFDYPGYGRSTGRPSEAGCYAAADAYYDWLVGEQKVPPERVLLYGGSLGGAVAVDVAGRRPHRGLVLVAAFTSIPDMGRLRYPFLPLRWLLRNRFDSLAKIGRVRGPIFLAHGTADRVVPFWMGERLFAAANPPKEFFPLDGYDHHHTPPPAFYDRLQAFLDAAPTGT